MTFPIAIGREGWETPLGSTTILRKRANPTWTPPDSIREENPDLPEVFPPGPDNPLGLFAIDLNLPGILIHGTNKPSQIGLPTSHGCIRLYPEDIESLFNVVEIGTKVSIIESPYKLGWKDKVLFLEIHPAHEEVSLITKRKKLPAFPKAQEIYHALSQMTLDSNIRLNWKAIDDAISSRTGLPTAIGLKD